MRKCCWFVLFVCATTFCFAAEKWHPANGPLKTRWAKKVSSHKTLPEYPRPQLVRKQWLNLNGLWDYAVTAKEAAEPKSFDGKILVPFPIESALSGVMKMVSETNRIWYHRTFKVPSAWKNKNVIVHFGAVDWDTMVLVNGSEVGTHRGGYDGFSFDITHALNREGDNDIIVSVWDPTDAGTQPHGKQIRNPHGIWYTPTSGIWQTVWLEPVQPVYVKNIKITPMLDNNAVQIRTDISIPSGEVQINIEAVDHHKVVATDKFDLANNSTGAAVMSSDNVLRIPTPKLWTPETPFLYDLKVTVKSQGKVVDEVKSYFAIRKISLGKDDKGFTRILLNNKPVFQFGPLDQGFWPDGIYTAPTDEALRYDIDMTKKFGFNMARKHVKVEPDRWYYWCDKLGLLVWQDMPSGDRHIAPNQPDIKRSPESAAEYNNELKAMIDTLYNHPCIVMWVPFNEGWGQFDTEPVVKWIKNYDPSRLVDDASGWCDRRVGDVNDMHKYPGPGSPPPEKDRAVVLGEFGGLGLPLEGHTWQQQKNWGYRSFTDRDSLTAAYVKLARELFPLIDSHGLSAAVYTQTTDVEVEVNGLMTYDREIVKPDLKKMVAANLNKFPPLPKKTVVLDDAETATTYWRYTTNQPAADWNKPTFDDSSWSKGRAGFGTRGTPGGIIKTEWSNSDIWIRRDFDLSAVPKHPKLSIHHDEDAEVFINGVLAAKLSEFTSDYEPAEMSLNSRQALKQGKNVIAIHCHQTGGGQYIDAGIIDLAE